MATDLGKAYVQIMPSAKGIKGSIQKTLDPEATSAGKSAGLNIASAIKGVIAAAGIGTALKNTIMQGGDLEQSIGGIETLFKDSADQVREYANEAYKTVGVSANEYMENVTSFSASLLQSMGGDTKEAAKVANMAMVDMGDNANKMGTDMRDIQNAYQGFAKQNYTMLDNLKLGYGGTKREMERLLADAQELSGVEYNIENLDDVYQAIHVIQEELGITGTTALEAEETITGSLNALKAAFTDVLGALAIGENLEGSLNALSETLSTFLFDNLIPMVGNILTALPGALMTFAQASLPQFMEVGMSFIQSITAGIESGLPQIIDKGLDFLINFTGSLRENVGVIVEAGLNLVIKLAEGIAAAMPSLIAKIPQIVINIAGMINDNAPKILQAGIQILITLGRGLIDAIPTIKANIPIIIEAIVASFMAFNWLNFGKNIMSFFRNGIGSMTGAIRSAATNIKDNILTAIRNLPQNLMTLGRNAVSSMSGGLRSMLGSLTGAARSLGTGILRVFRGLPQQMLGIGKSIIQGLWRGISSAKDWVMNLIGGFAGDIIGWVKKKFGVASPSKVMADEVGKWLPAGLAEGIENNIKPVTQAMDELTDLTTGTMTSELVMSANMNGSAIGGTSSQRVINVYNENHSPDPLTEREIARQTRLNLQRLAYQL